MRYLGIALLASSLSACTPVAFVSDYDEQTDLSATNLEREGDAFYQHLINADGTKECLYAKTKPFYDKIQIDLSVMKTRADARPKNGLTSSQIDNVRNIFSLEEKIQLEKVKKAKEKHTSEECISKSALALDQQAFDSAVGAILHFELAKKVTGTNVKGSTDGQN